MGASFKANCGDLRNSQILKLFSNLLEYGLDVQVFDPLVNSADWEAKTKTKLVCCLKNRKYDSIIYANNHDIFSKFKKNSLRSLLNSKHLILDMTYKLKFTDHTIRI